MYIAEKEIPIDNFKFDINPDVKRDIPFRLFITCVLRHYGNTVKLIKEGNCLISRHSIKNGPILVITRNLQAKTIRCSLLRC